MQASRRNEQVVEEELSDQEEEVCFITLCFVTLPV